MKRFAIELSDDARRDITGIGDYIAERANPVIATAFVERILATIDNLAEAPHRGTRRDDIDEGCRTFGFERRATILFRINERRSLVTVLGVFYAGRIVSAPAKR